MTFGQPAASIGGYAGGWALLNFDCLVSNPWDSDVQRKLTIWSKLTVPFNPLYPGYPAYEGEWKELYVPGYSDQVIALPPGGSVTYHYSGADHADDPVFLMQSMSVYYFELRDDLGNRSPEVYIAT